MLSALFILVSAFIGFAFLGTIAAPPSRSDRELYERRRRDGPLGRR